MMRIALAHNYYQQPGGEDQVFAAEGDLLLRHGHQVFFYKEHNRRIDGMNPLAVAAQTIWSHSTKDAFRSFLRENTPDVVHFHNTFPLMSPAVYAACREEGVAVVQTLHNYRLICPAATLFRDGHACEDCVGRSLPWPGIRHACYRHSRVQTSVVAAMLAIHNAAGTWRKSIDRYICLTKFARQTFVRGGLPEKKLMIKPNFINAKDLTRDDEGEYALYVGRLSHEKGVRTLLNAWEKLPSIPLYIIGDGPLHSEVESKAATLSSVKFLGRQNHDRVLASMKSARFLIFPSICYEGFPMTIVEAFANGLPVIASKIGGMGEIITAGKTGLHFSPGDVGNLAETVARAWVSPADAIRMGKDARAEFESKYSPDKNYEMLLAIYKQAMSDATSSR